MKSTFLNFNNSYLTYILLCMVLITHISVFAQQTTLPNTPKKDTVIDKKKLIKKPKPITFNGADGPYITKDSLLYRVTSTNKFTVAPLFNRDSIVVKIDNPDKNEFYFSLKSNYTTPETVYGLPDKMVVISDIEGKYDAFASFLFANKVIDENHNWIYGNGHLVLNGDFVDRGKNVTQVLWLIYKLDHQAKAQNGMVHFILGNHEILNFQGDHRYNRKKYIKVAKDISELKDNKEAIKHLYSKNFELGKWLATKNVIEKIGPYLFVHAGISPEILDYNLELETINQIVRSSYSGLENFENKTLNFLYSPKGPFWYRGLVKQRFQYDKITKTELEAVLKFYGSTKIVIGHTPVKNITTGFNGSVILTDVDHLDIKFTGKTKGLLIENNQEFIINDKAARTPLKIDAKNKL